MRGPVPRFLRWLLIAFALSPAPVAAGPPPDSAFAVVKITSEPAGLRVFSDTSLIGRTPFESGPLPAGVFRFRVFGADPGLWASPGIFDSVFLRSGDTVERHVVLPRFVRLTSEPSGAEVLFNDSTLGATPLYALLPRGAVTLSLRRTGFSDGRVLVPEGIGNFHAVMTPLDSGAAPGLQGPLAAGTGESSAPVVVALSVAVVSGAVSAYLKTRADTYYDDYRVSGNGATLDRVRRFDRFAGIALGVTELSLGYLIMQLLSR